jgi:hypothetical protein
MIAEYIPAAYRKAIYTILATTIALEAIFDIVPDIWEGKVLQALAVLGFGMAVTQTKDTDY